MGDTGPQLTRAGRRFQQLIVYLMRGDPPRGRKAIGRLELAARIGVDPTLLSKWRKPTSSLRKGLTDGVIQGCQDGLQVDPRYFFSDLPEPLDVGEVLDNVFSLEKARGEARERTRDSQIATLNKRIDELTRIVLELTKQQNRSSSR